MSVTDPDWKERIVAAAEGRDHQVVRKSIDPFHLQVHENQPGNKRFAIEVRPRAGVWAPFLAAIPLSEKESVNPSIMIGPRSVPTSSGMLVNTGSEENTQHDLYIMVAGNQATPTQSYFVWCDQLPSNLIFGVNNGAPQYTVALGAV